METTIIIKYKKLDVETSCQLQDRSQSGTADMAAGMSTLSPCAKKDVTKERNYQPNSIEQKQKMRNERKKRRKAAKQSYG